MKKIYTCLLFLLITHIAHAQCTSTINHWESCVVDTVFWKYKIPTSTIANWNTVAFNDASWLSGQGGIGFGDADDNTVVANGTNTVYMRRNFTIVDTSVIKMAIFCMDYDDGFVAFLNGKEIARKGVAPNQQWNTNANINHEAQLYQNGQPDTFIISSASLDTLLVNGNNVLAVEVHNINSFNTDLTSRPFLQLAITNATYNYLALPSWFVPPMDLFETKLPIVHINTLGQTIVDDPRITCDMGIIYNGPGNLNCSNGLYNEYNGKITIEHRGSTSQSFFPKKPYGFTTVDAGGNSLNVSLLGYPAENDWVLLAPYTDKTFMRDVLTYDLGRAFNWYTSRTQFVELIINGVYQGVHVLLEKIKRDDNRVNISKITPTSNTGDSLTGGYIFKIDKQTGNSGNGWNTSNQNIYIQHHDPDYNEVTATQHTYLENYVNSFESALFGTSFTNPNTGYRKLANVYSFADLFIINELSNNIDGYRLSTFAHKDRNSKCGRFAMGPYWDYNLSFGNGDYCYGYEYDGWQLYQGCGTAYLGSGQWIDRMLQDPWFKNIVNCRWNELRSSTLSTTNLMARIDTMASYLQESAVRDSTIWQTIGTTIWPNGWVADTWQGEIDSMKQWLSNRLTWMDNNMYPSTQSCTSVSSLTVVIDELNFNSDPSTNAGDWLELFNYGSSSVDISNAVLLDDSSRKKYCIIPNGTIIGAGQRLVIYEDSIKFVSQFPSVTNKIGPLCFKLNDGGQQITMKDKDNKLITSFVYNDNWQCAADGKGRTLQLSSAGANPNLAASWFAGCMGGSPGVAYTPYVENTIWSEINYNSAPGSDAGDWIELHNKNSTPINLSLWSVKNDDDSIFVFPSNFILPAAGYRVLYSDATLFSSQFPTVSNTLGPIGFNWSNTGESIRLYNPFGVLRYSVCYSALAPWPTDANAGGKTLENGQYAGNANNATSWFAGCPQGSPGTAYQSNCAPVFTQAELIEPVIVYPNPTNSILYIESTKDFEKIRILDITGRVVYSSNKMPQQINTTNLGKGNYILQCQDKSSIYQVKFSKY